MQREGLGMEDPSNRSPPGMVISTSSPNAMSVFIAPLKCVHIQHTAEVNEKVQIPVKFSFRRTHQRVKITFDSATKTDAVKTRLG
jgi:hypothetical protein